LSNFFILVCCPHSAFPPERSLNQSVVAEGWTASIAVKMFASVHC